MKSWRWPALIFAITLLGVIRVAATLHVFSGTLDEPAHIAAGYDWLVGRPYIIDASHPPLARALFAIPGALSDVEPPETLNFLERVNVRSTVIVPGRSGQTT